MDTQKGNTFFIIAIIVGVFAISAVGFASWKYFGGDSELEKETQPVYSPKQEKTVPQVKEQEKIKKEEIIPSEKTDETADWKSYQNEEYGFKISFPEQWKNYKVSEKDAGIAFKLKHQDGNYHDVFNISVYTKEQWNKIQSEEGPKPTYLSEDKKTDRIFAYSIGHDDEGYLGFPNIVSGKVYQGPYYDVQNKIIQTFKVIKTDWQTYQNKEYGFSLNFPLTWKGYKTSKRMLNWGAFGTSDSLDFGLPAQNSLFNISIHTKSQWKNIISEGGPRPIYIKENGKFVFAYAIAQDAINSEMIERIKEVKNIISTFKFTE